MSGHHSLASITRDDEERDAPGSSRFSIKSERSRERERERARAGAARFSRLTLARPHEIARYFAKIPSTIIIAMPGERDPRICSVTPRVSSLSLTIAAKPKRRRDLSFVRAKRWKDGKMTGVSSAKGCVLYTSQLPKYKERYPPKETERERETANYTAEAASD